MHSPRSLALSDLIETVATVTLAINIHHHHHHQLQLHLLAPKSVAEQVGTLMAHFMPQTWRGAKMIEKFILISHEMQLGRHMKTDNDAGT